MSLLSKYLARELAGQSRAYKIAITQKRAAFAPFDKISAEQQNIEPIMSCVIPLV